MTDEPFDPNEAQRIADALVATLPDPETMVKVYDAISYRVALSIVAGDVKFKTVRESLEAAKVFQKIAVDLRTGNARQAAAKAAEEGAEAIKNLSAPDRRALLKELTERAQAAAKDAT